MKDVLPYRIPPLYCPVPLRLHPESERLKRRLENDLLHIGLLTVPDHRQAYDSLQLGEFFGLCHPIGDVEDLLAVAPAFVLAFLADNPQRGDEHSPGMRQGLTGSLPGWISPTEAIELVAAPATAELLTDPLGKAFLHANIRLREHTSAGKYELYISRFLEWFRMEERLTHQEAAGHAPGINEALENRIISVGMPTVAAYMAAAHPDLTIEQVRSPQVSAVWTLASIATTMQNDLHSGYVDLHVSHNMIQTIARESRISLQQAADRVAALADRATVEALRRIRAFERAQAPQPLLDYLNVAMSYPAAALRWFYPRQMTHRYSAAGMDLAQAAATLSDTPSATGAPGIRAIDHLWSTANDCW